MSEHERPVYLDYNATTPHDPEVVEAMMPFLTTEFGNPSSSHVYGSEPRRADEHARAQVAALIGASAGEIVFTSGGTESNNYAILGTARARSNRGRHIITSNIEHPAVLGTCAALENDGFEVTRIPVDGHGVVDPARLRDALRGDTILVTVMMANNEIGTIEPIARIAELAHEHGAWIHTDAAQAVGKVPVSVDELGVDMLTIAGHKLYAPKGVGALYLRDGVGPQLIMYGGSQERGLRPGTENVLEVVGLGAAAEVAQRDAGSISAAMRRSRDRLADAIASECDVVVNGHPTERLPNTLNVSFRSIRSNDLLAQIAADVAASAGSACHADSVTLSPVIAAVGTPPEYAPGTIRFSTGKPTTDDEIDRAAAAIVAAYRRLQAE